MYLEEMKMKQLTKLMEEMKQGVYRDTLKDIYIDESVIAHQEERYVKAMAEYQKLYGDREVEVYSARDEVKLVEIIQIISTEWCLQPLLIWMRSQL